MLYSFPTPPRAKKHDYSDEENIREYLKKCIHHFDGQQKFADEINKKLDEFGILSPRWDNNRISSVNSAANGSQSGANQNEYGRFTRIIWIVELIYREIHIEEQRRSIALSGLYFAISPSFNVFRNICVGLMQVKKNYISLFTINKDNAVSEKLEGYLFLSDLTSQGLAAHISNVDREQLILFRGPEAGRRRAITIGRTDGGASPYAMPYVMYHISSDADDNAELGKQARDHCNIYSPEAFREKCNEEDFAGFFPEGYGCDQIINSLNEAKADGITGLKID